MTSSIYDCMGLMTTRTVGKPLHDNPLNVCQTWIKNPQEKKTDYEILS